MPPTPEATQELTEITLGESYTDSVTGFSGIATHRCESMSDPDQILLENSESSRWCSISRLSESAVDESSNEN